VKVPVWLDLDENGNPTGVFFPFCSENCRKAMPTPVDPNCVKDGVVPVEGLLFCFNHCVNSNDGAEYSAVCSYCSKPLIHKG
jgi:hypothetical protein